MSLLDFAQETTKQRFRTQVPKDQRSGAESFVDLGTSRNNLLQALDSSDLRNVLGQTLASNSGPLNGDFLSALSSTIENIYDGNTARFGPEPVAFPDLSELNIPELGPGRGNIPSSSEIQDLPPVPNGLGDVSPYAELTAQEIAALFGNPYGMGGRAGRSNKSDHPAGRAIDIMTGNGSSDTLATGAQKERGDGIVQYLFRNWSRLNVKYIIWNGRLWNGPGNGRPFRGSGGDGYGGRHGNHVHVSFNN